MGGRPLEGHIAGPRNTRMEETSKDREERRRALKEAKAQNGL